MHFKHTLLSYREGATRFSICLIRNITCIKYLKNQNATYNYLFYFMHAVEEILGNTVTIVSRSSFY